MSYLLFLPLELGFYVAKYSQEVRTFHGESMEQAKKKNKGQKQRSKITVEEN